MTPEQKRVLLEKAQEYSYDDSTGHGASSAADICAFVESLIAAERAATIERCAKVCEERVIIDGGHSNFLCARFIRALPKDANG